MIQRSVVRNITPFLLFFVFLLDTHASSVLTNLVGKAYVVNVHLTLIILLLLTSLLTERFLLITAVIVGIILDLYYLGMVGIYATILPATVFLMYFFGEAVQQNRWTLLFATIIFTTFYEVALLLLQAAFKLINIDASYFITHYLWPTLLINIVIFAILIIPLEALLISNEDQY